MDVNGDGSLDPLEFKSGIQRMNLGIDEQSTERFIRMIEKTQGGRIDYMEFLDKMNKTSNKNHNPFKTIVTRIGFFLKQNNLTPEKLIKRLSKGRHQGKVPLNTFSNFLKNKVAKKRTLDELYELANKIDIDNDSYIDYYDLNTCLSNLANQNFFSQGPAKSLFPTQKLERQKATQMISKIKSELMGKGMSFREAFIKFDQNQDGFLSYSEFSNGLDGICPISQIIKQKLFAEMDIDQIGLISYESFANTFKNVGIIQKGRVSDNFHWEEGVIQQIKDWIREEKLSVEDAFKNFDRDFDGFVNKHDLYVGLVEILKQDPKTISSAKVDRLFSLMDQYKTGKIQLADFRR